MTRLFLRKIQRLKTNRQIVWVLVHNCFAGNELMSVYIAKNDISYPRFAVSVGKRIAPAVLRNRLKRLAKEAFRLEQHNIAPNYDYLLIFPGKMSKKSLLPGESLYENAQIDSIRSGFVRFAIEATRKFPMYKRPDKQ